MKQKTLGLPGTLDQALAEDHNLFRFVANNHVYVAEREDTLVGFYALIIREGRAQLEHMWVAPEYIGTGVGKELFIHAMQSAAGQNVLEVEISSDHTRKASIGRWARIELAKLLLRLMASPTLPVSRSILKTS